MCKDCDSFPWIRNPYYHCQVFPDGQKALTAANENVYQLASPFTVCQTSDVYTVDYVYWYLFSNGGQYVRRFHSVNDMKDYMAGTMIPDYYQHDPSVSGNTITIGQLNNFPLITNLTNIN